MTAEPVRDRRRLASPPAGLAAWPAYRWDQSVVRLEMALVPPHDNISCSQYRIAEGDIQTQTGIGRAAICTYIPLSLGRRCKRAREQSDCQKESPDSRESRGEDSGLSWQGLTPT
jgi:hypothetical protein